MQQQVAVQSCPMQSMAHLIQGVGRAALEAHGVPEGLQHLKGDVQQVLVEEVHHVLTQAVAPLQGVTGPPAAWLDQDKPVTNAIRNQGAEERRLATAWTAKLC